MTGMMKISPEDSETLFGTPYGGEQDTYRGKPNVVYYYEMLKSAVDSIGVCYFTSQWVDIRFQGAKDYGDLLSAAAGIEISGEELMLLGRKIHNIEKGFNTLHGDFSLLEDFPPKRFFDEPIKSGPYKGSSFDRGQWLTMLKEYYSLHGWDPETGLQTEATLMELNLPFLVDKLKDANKLPSAPP